MTQQQMTFEQRATLFKDQAKEVREYGDRKTREISDQLKTAYEITGDLGSAVDTVLYTNPELRSGFNNLPETRKDPNLAVGYNITAEVAGDSKYFDDEKRYGRVLDTASNPGGANLIQTSLADSIIYKSEKLGQVLALVAKDEIPDGDKEYPRITASAVGTFIDETTTGATSQVATTYEVATDGLTKVKFTPRDFILPMTYTNRILKKVTPKTLAFFRDYEAKGITRGLEQQILRGNGSGQNATGISGLATSVTFSGNAYLTFNDAVGVLAANNTENIKAVMHRKTWQEYKKLRVINDSYRASIDPINMMIDDIPVILSNNADASVATTGSVYLGDYDHYLYANNGQLEMLTDMYTGAANRKTTVYHTLQVDLGALIPASFATFSITF